MTSLKRLALVTGSTKGIGEAIAKNLAVKAKLHVLVTGRDRKRGEEVADVITKASRESGSSAEFVELDMESAESIERIKKKIEVDPSSPRGLDVLVNNAGASFDGFNEAIAQKTMDVNFIGMMRLTDRLVPLLRHHARVVMVSSGMGEVSILSDALRAEVMSQDLDRARLMAFTSRFVESVARGTHRREGWPSNAYSVSKVAMNAYVRILARDLRSDPRKILVNAACPGWVRTAMGGSHAPRTVAQGASTPTWLALLPESDTRSGVFFRDEQPIPW